MPVGHDLQYATPSSAQQMPWLFLSIRVHVNALFFAIVQNESMIGVSEKSPFSRQGLSVQNAVFDLELHFLKSAPPTMLSEPISTSSTVHRRAPIAAHASSFLVLVIEPWQLPSLFTVPSLLNTTFLAEPHVRLPRSSTTSESVRQPKSAHCEKVPVAYLFAPQLIVVGAWVGASASKTQAPSSFLQ